MRKLSDSSLDVEKGGEFDEEQEIAWKDEELEDLSDNLLVEDGASSMGAWVPVGSVSCLEGLDPLPMEIMGRKFVVWRGADGQWSFLKDECPHRMVPLSQGRVDPATKCLECAFHGWQFDPRGTLVRIPHLEAEGDLRAESRSVDAYATHTTGDLLWVFLPTSFHGESFPRALLPEDYYHGLASFVDSKATYYSQEMPFSFDFFIEK
jgi:phenylpropionate dioxygenase-like ring-hydroxylating dioxygenase large terminal subunit